MLFKKNSVATGSIVTVLLVVMLAAAAFADSPMKTTAAQRKLADHLENFKATATALRHEADTLQSPGTRRLTWQTQNHYLGNIKTHVNNMGKTLAELESLTPMASESQALAIEHSRSHLVSVAENATRALDLIRENRSSVQFNEFGEAVNDIQVHAEALHSKLDTILDFEDARIRLEALDLPTTSTEGS